MHLEEDKELIEKWVEIINISKNKGIEDGYNELESEVEKFKHEKDNSFLLKTIIKWKRGYLESLNSDYYFFDKLSMNSFHLSDRILQSKNESLVFIAIDFYKRYNYKNNSIDKDLEYLAEEVRNCFSYITIYEKINLFINEFNNSISIKLTLPAIDNFETDMYDLFHDAIQKNEKLIKYLNEKYLQTSSKLSDIKGKISILKNSKEDLENKLRSNNNYVEMIKNDYTRVLNNPVSQFNILYWGDNYPALKVLYDFLLINKMIEIGWSDFSNVMGIENIEPFNINLSKFSKEEFGYLMYRIKDFFIQPYSRSKKEYSNWIEQKIFINNSKTNNDFIRKHLRSNNKTKDKLKNALIIDDLVKKINTNYHYKNIYNY